jgi:phosphoglycerate dehydrogenase-like enzyme
MENVDIMRSGRTILVGMSLHPDARAALDRVAQVTTWSARDDDAGALLERAEALLTYVPSFEPRLLDRASGLKVIACHACPAPVREAAQARGIQVTHAPSLWDTVADQALALMFAAARNTAQADRAVRGGHWGQTDLKVRFSGHDVFGKTLGIVGLGKIGSAVAKRVQGFEMTVLYADPARKPELELSLRVQHRPLHDLLAQSDIVIVTVPLNDETRGLIGASELRLLKPEAILVNPSRGALIDEPALCAALEARRIAAAGLDVFVEEPLPPGHPLLSLDNVVLSPHLGGSTKECDMVLVEDTLRVLRGEVPRFPMP